MGLVKLLFEPFCTPNLLSLLSPFFYPHLAVSTGIAGPWQRCFQVSQISCFHLLCLTVNQQLPPSFTPSFNHISPSMDYLECGHRPFLRVDRQVPQSLKHWEGVVGVEVWKLSSLVARTLKINFLFFFFPGRSLYSSKLIIIQIFLIPYRASQNLEVCPCREFYL